MAFVKDVLVPAGTAVLIGTTALCGLILAFWLASEIRVWIANSESVQVFAERFASDEPLFDEPTVPVVDEAYQTQPAPVARNDFYGQQVQAQADTRRHEADVASFNALRRNCEQAAANNARGEYPALQQMACNRFAQFAASKGWDSGALPPVLTVAPRSQDVQVIHRQVEQVEASACPGLIAEKTHIDSIMRRGYTEPAGNHYRARLHAIDLKLWELKCKLH